MADHPLRPATDHRLGRPLPHQPANQTQPLLKAPRGFPAAPLGASGYAVLAAISDGYPPLQGRLATRYSPGRRSNALADTLARLALIRHAASVYPEPGSNSPTVSRSLPRVSRFTLGAAAPVTLSPLGSCAPGPAPLPRLRSLAPHHRPLQLAASLTSPALTQTNQACFLRLFCDW